MKRVLARARALLSLRRVPPNAHGLEPGNARFMGDGELPVLAYQALEARVGTKALIDQLRIRLGFPPEVFCRAVLPVIERYAEFVQLLPVPQCERHMSPGGLYVRSMEVAIRTLDYRRAQILPRGAAPEVIGAQAHRWTYAAFIAALLCEADSALAGLRIRIRGIAGDETWDPHSGPMSERGAVSYRVEVSGATTFETERALPPRLLKHLVPPLVFEWLAADPDLMQALSGFLSGDGAAPAGAIGELVERASGSPEGSDAPRSVKKEWPPQQTASAQHVASALAAAGFDERPANGTAAGPPEAVTTNETGSEEDQEEYLEDFEIGESKSVRDTASRSSMGQGPDAASCFMGWLRESVADGKLSVNAPGSLVHFVPEGMLLVSPRIFREFAKWRGERGAIDPVRAESQAEIGKSIQREVLRARWHLRAPGGVNICTYHVMRHGRAASRVAGLVVLNPERFVDHLPAANPALVRIRGEAPEP